MPFLKPRNLAATIIASKSVKGPIQEDEKASEDMLKIAESLLSAIADKDAERVAKALKNAWECMESYEVEDEQEA